jgi:hypothetical protein
VKNAIDCKKKFLKLVEKKIKTKNNVYDVKIYYSEIVQINESNPKNKNPLLAIVAVTRTTLFFFKRSDLTEITRVSFQSIEHVVQEARNAQKKVGILLLVIKFLTSSQVKMKKQENQKMNWIFSYNLIQ